MLEKLRSLRIPIRLKLMVLFVGVTGAALVTAIAIARNNSSDALIASARDAQLNRVQNTTQLLNDYLNGIISDYTTAGYSPDVVALAAGGDDITIRERARAALVALQKRDPYQESAAIVDSEGNVRVSSIPAEDDTRLVLQPYLTNALTGKAGLSDVHVSLTTDSPVFAVAAPIRGANGQVFGVVRGRYNLAGVLGHITDDASTAGKGSESVLVDESGLRLAMSDSSMNFLPRNGGRLLTAIAEVPSEKSDAWVRDQRFGIDSTASGIRVDESRNLADLLSTGLSGVGTLNDGATGKVEVAYATMTVKPWKYAVTVPRNTVTAAAAETTEQLLLVGLITAVATAVVAFFVSLRLTSPIRRLAKAADAVSMGDINQSVEVDSNDEIGDLAGAFGRMVASVRFYMTSAEENEADGAMTDAA